jgi:Tol biopolymer transport system component
MKFLFAAFLYCFTSLLYLSVEASSQTFTVKGNVHTPDMPVRFASITFTNQSDTSEKYSALTDSEGNFQLSIVTGVFLQPSAVPQSIELAQNYPNPFSSSTAISYQLNKQTDVSVTIYDILGREVKKITVGLQTAGVHGVVWDGKNNFGEKVAVGVYFYRLQAKGEVLAKKMVFGTDARSIFVLPSKFYFSNDELKKYSGVNFTVTRNFKVQLINNANTIPQILDKEFNEVRIETDTTISFTAERASNDYDLCYMKIANGNWELFLNNIMGTNPKNITNWGEEDSSPAWSPDGKSIAFQKFETTGAHLFLYDTEKDTQIDLTHDFSFQSSQPQWLPNSDKIVYTFHRIGEKRFTYIIDSNGANNRKLLNSAANIFFYNDSYNFIYKPTGIDDSTDYCVFKADIYNTIFVDFIINLKNIGKNYVDVYDFDPVKNKILILADPTERFLNFLVTYNIDSKKIDTVSVADSGWVYAGPKFSNDYSKIAVKEINFESSIKRLSLIEGEKKTVLYQLTDTTEWIDFHPLAFSPDNKLLAFSKNIYGEGPFVWWTSYLYIIDIETKQLTFIDQGVDPQWNPK